MKIITLWQPWASLVALGLKQYETRSWSTQYQGGLLIHAAKRPFIRSEDGITFKVSDEQANFAWLDALRLGHESGLITDDDRIPFAWQLPLGRIVAKVDLIGCYPMGNVNGYDGSGCKYIRCDQQTELERAVGDWQSGRYAWKLKNIRSFHDNPIPWKGGQGLRDAPQDLIDLVGRQTKEVVNG